MPSAKSGLTPCCTFGQIPQRWAVCFCPSLPKSAMAFPLHQHEWWFCQDPDCSSSDRVYGLQAQSLAHWWLQQLKDDPFRMQVLRDLVRSDISLSLFRVGDATLVSRMEQLLISGRLHFHKKEPEIQSGSRVQDKQVPFPLSDRQPRAVSPPPPVIDPPSFSSKANLSAQAAVLVAAAASGTPFCRE
jgi:hypothetical protein